MIRAESDEVGLPGCGGAGDQVGERWSNSSESSPRPRGTASGETDGKNEPWSYERVAQGGFINWIRSLRTAKHKGSFKMP